jgi:hypothetical protein
MKMKLLGGAALAIALTVSSGAWANPKNSFSDGNITAVYSAAVAVSTGNIAIGNSAYGGAGGSPSNSSGGGGGGGAGGTVDNSGASTSTSVAISESFNVSIEGVEVSNLSSYSTGWVEQYGFKNKVEWGDANANAGTGGTNSGLFQSSASNGVGNATTQGQSIAAAAEVSF